MINDKLFWTDEINAETFGELQIERLQKAQQALERMLTVRESRTIENTLAAYDEILLHLNAARSQAELMQEVHPDESFRSAAEEISQKAAAFATELSINRRVFEALSEMDLTGADDETRHYAEKTLRDFRLAGVDRDDETRAKIRALRDELVLIGQEFSRNIRDDREKITIDSQSELEGLPQDYIDNHPPDADGKIVLTTEYPDFVPVMSYAKSDSLRRRLFIAFNNRAHPQNLGVLDRMAAKRFELARLLGFQNWADYVTADKMIGSAQNALDFIDRIVEASAARADAEYRELLARKQQDFPDASVVNRWETSYYAELVRRANYNFDAQSVRPYFSYRRVKNGVLDVMSRLFGVEFKQIENAPVWHPSVECWEMFEAGELIGRFYLDMHPRDGKYSHAAQFDIRTGIGGRQIPEAALVCNFPAAEPALMEHGDVQTFFHEFGHLLHSLFAGRGKWIGVGGISTEWDFVEAPSQLLEEWTLDTITLQSFARHYQTDEPIPAELVGQMRRAKEFGKALHVRQQMVYARLSLSIYDRPPEEVNTDALVRSISEKYLPYPYLENTHLQTSFGHLDSYSAIYYTYMWSLVLAKDMFSRFDQTNLLDGGEVAAHYRERVLKPGGSRPAEKLVEDFLGRKPDFAAWSRWLNDDANQPAY